MYLGKLLLVIGNFVISGSLWFALMFIYLALETVRTIRNEEQYLTTAVPEYAEYKNRTPMMIPFLL